MIPFNWMGIVVRFQINRETLNTNMISFNWMGIVVRFQINRKTLSTNMTPFDWMGIAVGFLRYKYSTERGRRKNVAIRKLSQKEKREKCGNRRETIGELSTLTFLF